MFTAALFGRKAALAMLLETGGSPDLPNRNGMTALDAATSAGHPEILELLLDALADSNNEDARELTDQADAMRAAAHASRSHIDACIATHAGDGYTQPEKQFSRELETFLFDLREHDHFLERHATPDPEDADLLNTIQERQSQLVARKKNALGTMAHLMTLGSSANVEYDLYKTGHTGLHYAAKRNYPDLAQILLLLGADVSCVDYEQDYWSNDNAPRAHFTPLQYACEKAHGKMIELLLQNGASPNEHTRGTRHNTAQLLTRADSALMIRLLPGLQRAGLDLNWQNEADSRAPRITGDFGLMAKK